MKLPIKYKALGLMSGTSRDGLDLAYCQFIYQQDQWSVELMRGYTKKYSAPWRRKLSRAPHLTSADLITLDYEFGRFTGATCREFIKNNRIGNPDIIASHGHTVFHQPEKGFTYQIGNGNAIHAITGIPVVHAFRSLDIALGGEGAPLTPMGDFTLFSDYSACLNLGGIANLSIRRKNSKIAYDICFANMGLNHLAEKAHKTYDKGGQMASRGTVDARLLKALHAAYLKRAKKKGSLGHEGFTKNIQPLLDKSTISLEDKMCTFCESIAIKISEQIPHKTKKITLFITGGGALNNFLMDRLKAHIRENAKIILPPKPIIQFKEAMIFAFLGILRIRGEVNVLKAVTGSKKNSSSGCITGFIPYLNR